MKRLLTALVLLALGCRPEKGPVKPVGDRDVPPAELTQVQPLPPTPQIMRCREQEEVRERVQCLEQFQEPATIDELVLIGRETMSGPRAEDHSSRYDFARAADAAAAIAAATSESRLLVWAKDEGIVQQAFAAHALAALIRQLRTGYRSSQGAYTQRDPARADFLSGAIGEACARMAQVQQELVVEEAVACLGATQDAAHTDALVKVAVNADSARIRFIAINGLAQFTQPPPTSNQLQPLAAVLQSPFPVEWRSEDVSARMEICRLIERTGGAPWAAGPARTAAAEIGDKSSHAKRTCERAADAAAGPGMGRPQPGVQGTRDYFARTTLKRCRFATAGSGRLEFCASSRPLGSDGRKRRFELTVSDAARRVKARHAVRTREREYVVYELTNTFDLNERTWLVVVPLVTGSPDSYTRRRTVLLTYDTRSHRFASAWTSPACGTRNCKQDIQLHYRKGEPTKNVKFINAGKTHTTLRWDGRRLIVPPR